MHNEQSFHDAMLQNPADNNLRLVFADWLEERGDQRGELIRLLHTLTQEVDVPGRDKLEDRLRALLAGGVKPVGPFWTNSLGMKFAWIPAGTFLMGSPEDEEGRGNDETQHEETLTRGFWLAIHLVTQSTWQTVMGNNPSESLGDNLPVEQVSWDNCQEFLRNLKAPPNHVYRLPTETEWEYACRAGSTTPFSFGETISTDQANFDGYYPYGATDEGLNRGETTPVDMFRPNAFGLHDMHGNVLQWCDDWHEPAEAQSGEYRVLRGSCFYSPARSVRSAVSIIYLPSNRGEDIGFRPAMISF